MSWTTPEYVQNSWIGPGVPEDEQVLQTWIDRAERKIRREVHDIADRLAVPDTDPVYEPDLLGTVQDVVAEMVERKFRNPEGVRTAQDTTGPMSGSVTYGGDQPGQLWLTPDNLADLQTRSTAGKAFSVDLLEGYEERHPLDHAWINGPDRYAPGGRA